MAARTIDKIHTLIEFIERKQTGSYHSHPEIDAALDAAQKEFLKERYAAEDYDAIAVFKKSLIAFSATAGILVYPDDLEYFLTAFAGTVTSPIPIREVDEDELPDALNSQLRAVTATKPIATQGTTEVSSVIKKCLNIYPQVAYTGRMSYYRTPRTPLYSYSQAGRVITYISGSSVQMEVSDVDLDKVIGKALGFLGTNASEEEVVQFGLLKDKTA